MTQVALSTYEFSIFVHITAVVVGFGATFAESVMFPVAMSLDPRHLPYVHRLQMAINKYLATPGLVLVLLTGLYQVEEGNFDFGAAWISASMTIIIVLGGLIGGYFIPSDRKLGPMVEREIAAAGDGEVTLSDEYQRKAKTQGAVGALAGVLVVVAIFLMVVQPGA